MFRLRLYQRYLMRETLGAIFLVLVAFLALWYAVAMLLRRNGRIPARSAAGFALAGIVPVLLVLWVGSHAY